MTRALQAGGYTPNLVGWAGIKEQPDLVISFPDQTQQALRGHLDRVTAAHMPRGTRAQPPYNRLLHVTTSGGLYLSDSYVPGQAAGAQVGSWWKDALSVIGGIAKEALPVVAQVGLSLLAVAEEGEGADPSTSSKLKVDVRTLDPTGKKVLEQQALYFDVTPGIVRGTSPPSSEEFDGAGNGVSVAGILSDVGPVILDILSASLPALAGGRDAFIKAAISQTGQKLVDYLDRKSGSPSAS